jgi:alpha-2-macroglobulin
MNIRTTFTQATVAVLSSLMLLTACGPKSDGDAPSGNRAEVGIASAFSLADCKARLLDGSPAVALMFTQPLARSQDWGKLLQAKEGDKLVSNRWVLSDNPRVLMLANATPDSEYHVQLSAEVASSGGQKLATVQNCTVKAEAMPESFYFASKGVVLPAGQNGGLPVVTVNTPEVDMQFLRINADALPRFLEQVGGRREPRADNTESEYEGDYEGDDNQRKLKGTISGYQLDALREMATSVYLGRFATDERKNRRNVSFLPVEKIKELQEPGVYVAVMNPPGRFGWDFQVTYFYVTDIGLHVRRHAAQTDVFTTSLKKGEALRSIEVSLIDDAGKVLAQAKTDTEGHAVFAGSTDKARALLARRGKEISVIALRDPALDLSEFDIGGHPSRNLKLFMYAGRDLYRPGENFTVSVLARDADGKPLQGPQQNSSPAAPLTLVLKKPDGSQASTQLVRPHEKNNGYFQANLTLPANAPTGRWLLEAKTDPGAKRADAQWAFSVEEFLPERMKLLLTAPEVALQGKAPLTVNVQGDYLYGAPAVGNRLLGSLTTERQRFPVAKTWPGFIFGDVADDNNRKRQDLSEDVLDEAGKAAIEVPIDLNERNSPMTVRASFSLLETGGRPVVRSIERTWWPVPEMVGLRPLFDRDVAQEGGLAEFELTRVNAQGQFSPGKDIAVRLLREERQWYWRYDDGRGWNSGYNEQEELIEARTVALPARSKLSLPVKWGRYRLELTDPQTGHTSRYRFYAGWGAQDADDVGNRPDRVQLKLEGAPFNALSKSGGKARLTITPPHDGEALLTVEGDRVLYQKRLSVRTSGTVVELPVDPAWQRHDLYVSVVAFRPGSQGDRVTPARALGLVHLPLAREDRKLKLALTAPAKAVPEQTVPVKVKLLDAAGKPLAASSNAIVTVSAVDVGILNITNYPTPNPTDFFFGKHRYGADLIDHYGKLIEAMEGNMAKQRFGGDAGMRDTQSMPRKVRLVDLFSGPVSLDANGDATIPLLLPDFNGTLRLMAVASTATSYASTQFEMQVAAPLVAELSMPRFISPGDSATIALDVTNLSGGAQTVSVKIDAESPLKITGTPPPVKLADKERTVLRFQAQALDAEGLAPIKLTVTAGALKVVRTAALQVQPATAQTREVRRVRIEPGSSHKLDPLLADGLWAGSATVEVSVSNKPPIDVRNVVQGLLMYPYGCLEQTTSSAYPLVFIDEAGAKAYKMTPLSREDRAKRLDVAFGRLAGMQQQNGGFGLWAANNPYEAWLSAYVTGFLQDAKDAGFAVPENLHQRAMASLLEQFQKAPGYQSQPPKEPRRDANGRLSDYREMESIRMAHQRFSEGVHAGYILAREQKAPLATLRVLHDTYRQNARSPLALIHLSLALKLMGDEARSQVALDDAMKLPWGIQPASFDNNHWGEWLGDYGSRIRDQALAYALMQRHQLSHPRRENLMLDLANDFNNRQYFSTQERLALFLAARAAGGDSGDQPWRATLTLADKTEQLSSKETEQRSVGAASLKRGASVSNQSETPLFIEVAVQGYPVKPLPPKDDRISIERTWWTVNGDAVNKRQFETGEMLIVRLRVNSKQRIKDGLIVDRIPAGMEIENLNLSQGVQASEFTVEKVNIAQAMEDKRIHHREFRDDRFVVAADLDGSKLDVFYVLRVVTPGKFVVPAAFAEDMYRPELRGVGKGEADVTVVSPK